MRGFHHFLKNNPDTPVSFIIIGSGIGNELSEIKQYISENNLGNVIHPLGYIPQYRLPLFFKHADCGLSFTPITRFYDIQPNTKTYEYLVNGIPIIATASKDNIRVFNSATIPCGVLIKDTAEEFSKSISEMLAMRDRFCKETIAQEFKKYEWDNLFKIYLEDALMLNSNGN